MRLTAGILAIFLFAFGCSKSSKKEGSSAADKISAANKSLEEMEAYNECKMSGNESECEQMKAGFSELTRKKLDDNGL